VAGALAEHNLIRLVAEWEGEPRFGMLETIREYARECLVANGHAQAVARAHAAFFVVFGEQFYQTPNRNWASGMNQSDVLARFEAEHDNLRAAMGWATTAGEAEIALKLASQTKMFWQIRGHLTEGRRWFEATLAQAANVSPALRARALDSASFLTWMQGDYAAARTFAEEGLAICRDLDAQAYWDAKRALSSILYILAMIAQDQYDYATARACYEESFALGRDLGDAWRMGFTLLSLGTLSQRRGEYENARTYFQESLHVMRECGNTHGSAYPLNDLGALARDEGDLIAARKWLAESLVIRRDIGEKRALAQSLNNLGIVERDGGNYAAARALHEESLTLLRALGDRQGIAYALVSLAVLEHRTENDATAQGLCQESLHMAYHLGDRHGIAACLNLLAEIASAQEMLHAARLWGAANALRASIEMRLPPVDQAYYERVLASARALCTESAWAAAWEEGQHMGLEQAIRIALQDQPSGQRPPDFFLHRTEETDHEPA
jgi:tetratricopeptide (TPR) repeat protein